MTIAVTNQCRRAIRPLSIATEARAVAQAARCSGSTPVTAAGPDNYRGGALLGWRSRWRD